MDEPPPILKVTAPDEDRGMIITTALWSFVATATVLQLLRLYCRLKFKKLGWDDYWMFFTTITLAAAAVVVQISMNNGGGRHLYYLALESPQSVPYVAKLSWVSQPFLIMGLGFGKFSVGLLILRFLYASQRWLRYSVWFCIVTVNLALAGAVILSFAQCSPPQKLWQPEIEGTCWPPTRQTNYSVFSGAYSCAGDFFLAIVPLWILWPLQMKMRKKLGLCVIFSLGVIAGAFGIYKTTRIPGIASHGDITWDAYDALLYTGAEIWLIILSGSVPAVKPLWDDLQAFFQSMRNSYREKKVATFNSQSRTAVSDGYEISILKKGADLESGSRTQTKVTAQATTRSWSEGEIEGGVQGPEGNRGIRVHSRIDVDYARQNFI